MFCVGYAPNKKGYKCFNPKTRKTVISMDVTFLEHQPYFQKKFLHGEKPREEENFWDIIPTPLPRTVEYENSSFKPISLNKDLNEKGNYYS